MATLSPRDGWERRAATTATRIDLDFIILFGDDGTEQKTMSFGFEMTRKKNKKNVTQYYRFLMPMLTAHKLFFFFSPKLSYVPFVLARDHLGKLEMEK